jgi:hypothetical protein
MRANGYIWSFWQPNAEELAALVMGGSIALAVQGCTHPPLSVNATSPPATGAKAVTPEESAAITEAVRGRYNSLVKVAKRMAAMLAKNAPDTPERASLFDRLIDIVTLNVGAGEVVRGLPDDEPEATATQRDIDDYINDAAEWKADAERWRDTAERWRKTAEELAPEGIPALNERLEYAQAELVRLRDQHELWQAEAERWRKVAEESTMTDGQRTTDAGGWMNYCLEAEQRADRLQAAVDSVIDQLNRVSVENPNQPEG